MITRRPKIIDVLRKPQKCPVCGEEVVDIIYGTGDMTEVEFLMQYRREGVMGGDNIPRRPPVWECACGCRRFRKVDWDGTDAGVKPKMLKNIRRKPLELIEFSASGVEEAVAAGQHEKIHHYKVAFITERGERDVMSIGALSERDAIEEAWKCFRKFDFGFKGMECGITEVTVKDNPGADRTIC